MPELCIQLSVIMIGKQLKSILMETLIPWVKRCCKKCARKCKKRNGKTANGAVSTTKRTSLEHESIQWEVDYDLLHWGTFDLTEEYLEMVLQFGFVTIFVSAFPLAAFFALLNNIFELRIDAQKLVRHYRRPIGIRVNGIGVWGTIVEGIVKIGVLSNACIIAVTSNFIPKIMYRYFLYESSRPEHGTLNGYLDHTLTSYNTADLETEPYPKVLKSTFTPVDNICYFPTYRYDHSQENKYQFKMQHWKIWFARALFVILYENIVALLMLFLRWLIPDVPAQLKRKMVREERMINDIIIKQELARVRPDESQSQWTKA